MCARRDPQWASAITGCPVETIEEFARLVGATKRAYFRLGYGFSRSRNGPVNMHAASCIPAITGAWLHEGGGAFHNNADIYHWDKSMIEGSDVRDKSVRMLDQSRVGAILTGDREALKDGPPVAAMLIQNTNPVSVCPDQDIVKRGFAREDLFVCVHEQFMTETARMADVVLPATMFMEHDDVYQGGGHQYIILGPKLIEPPGECRSNHAVNCGIGQARRRRASGLRHERARADRSHAAEVGLGHAGAARAREMDRLPAGFRDRALHQGLRLSGRQIPLQAGLAEGAVPHARYHAGPIAAMPKLPDHWTIIEEADDAHPMRLATSPSRGFLNSTFNETPSSRAQESRPSRGDDPSRRCREARHRATGPRW